MTSDVEELCDNSSREVKDSGSYFEKVAAQWDTMRTGFFSETVREKAFDMAGVDLGKTAADIGAGTGFVTEGLKGRDVKVIAVDRSLEMLEVMKSKFGVGGTVEYRHGESENLPMADASVDYCFANMYLHHVENPAAAIKEMARILKPGGKLVITDLDTHSFDFLRTEHFDRWMGFDRKDIQSWLEAAGLNNVNIDCAGGNCTADSCCGSGSASISIFAALGQKA